MSNYSEILKKYESYNLVLNQNGCVKAAIGEVIFVFNLSGGNKVHLVLLPRKLVRGLEK